MAKGVAEGRKDVCDCVEIIVCPPFTHIAQVVEAVEGKNVAVGAQDCATEVKGAYTGEVSAAMIAALGCKYVILGPLISSRAFFKPASFLAIPT